MAIVRNHPDYPLFRMKLGVMPEFSDSKFMHQEIPEGDMNGANRRFVLKHKPLSDSLEVFKDGMLMAEGLDYQISYNTREVIFSANQVPQKKSVIRVSYKHY